MRGFAAAVSGAVLLVIVAVQLSGSAPDADGDALLARAQAGAQLKIEQAPRADEGKTSDFISSLKVLGAAGKHARLFDTSAEDLDGLSAQQITKVHQEEETAHRKAQEAAAKTHAAAQPKQAPKAHKPSLEEIKLDRAAAKEGDKLLAEDQKVAAEELVSPEQAVHQMMSKDKTQVAKREAAFQAHLKKMAVLDKSNEARHKALEAAKEKKVNGYVSSSDAAFERSLAAAVKKETAGHNEYNSLYSSEEQQVVARDKSFMQRVEKEKAEEAEEDRMAKQQRLLRRAKENVKVREALIKMNKASTAAWSKGEEEDETTVAATSNARATGSLSKLKDELAHKKENAQREHDVDAITGGVSDGVDQHVLEKRIAQVLVCCVCAFVVENRGEGELGLGEGGKEWCTYIHACMHTYLPTYIHTYLPTYIHAYVPSCIHTITCP